MNLQGGRIRTLLIVLHIPTLARNFISISKLDDAGVKIMFKKGTCIMVHGALVFMWEFGLELCTSFKVALLWMGETIP